VCVCVRVCVHAGFVVQDTTLKNFPWYFTVCVLELVSHGFASLLQHLIANQSQTTQHAIFSATKITSVASFHLPLSLLLYAQVCTSTHTCCIMENGAGSGGCSDVLVEARLIFSLQLLLLPDFGELSMSFSLLARLCLFAFVCAYEHACLCVCVCKCARVHVCTCVYVSVMRKCCASLLSCCVQMSLGK
jgi:hypothetical protein